MVRQAESGRWCGLKAMCGGRAWLVWALAAAAAQEDVSVVIIARLAANKLLLM